MDRRNIGPIERGDERIEQEDIWRHMGKWQGIKRSEDVERDVYERAWSHTY